MNPETHHDVAGQGRPSVRKLVIDPSDAVTGMSLVFGIVGAVMGVVSAVIVSDTWNAALILYCFLAAFAGGSAGVVTGGLVGAVLAVTKGVVPPRDAPRR